MGTIGLTKKEKGEFLNFEAFRLADPNFADRPLKGCVRGADPPDFLCSDSAGKRIGVELMQWVNEKQMAVSKARYRLEESYLHAIRSTAEPPPENIGLIWLSVKDRLPLKASSANQFREELYKFVYEVDAAWTSNPDWHDPQGCEFRTFTSYPCLAQHVDALDFYPRGRFSPSLGAEWITFPAHGGAYTPKWMQDALIENVRKKIEKYLRPHNKEKLEQQKLDGFYLMAYYDEAVLHNTPYHAPGFGFWNIGDALAQELAKNLHPFDKVFLFSSIEETQKVLQVWPRHL